jgi:hypothetical protein
MTFFVLFLTTTINCSEAFRIVNRIGNVIGLSYQQKIEVIQVVSQHVPSCPLKIVPDERPKSSN